MNTTIANNNREHRTDDNFKSIFCLVFIAIILSLIEKNSVIDIFIGSIPFPNLESTHWSKLVFSIELVEIVCKILFFSITFEIISTILESIFSCSYIITIITGFFYLKFSFYIEIFFNYCFYNVAFILEEFTALPHEKTKLIIYLLFIALIICLSQSSINVLSRITRNSIFYLILIVLFSIIQKNL